MKKHNDKKVILLGILGFLLIIGIVIGYSSAYFVASIVNKTPSQDALITTGSMELEFTDGSQVSLENTIPGSYVIKTFSVKNVGSVSTYYDIYLSDLINTFVDKSDLVFSLTSNAGGASVSETVVPSESSKIVSNQLINVNKTHYYTLRIDFKETDENQDDNTGKLFSSVIRINEVQDAPKAYEVLSGDLDTIGSLVKIANEEFYVIGQQDSTHVKLLSKWNLNVGPHAKGTATGLQDSDVRGDRDDGGTQYGNVVFSTTSYWKDGNKLKEEYGTSYPVYAFDDNSNVKQYVDNYVTYLNNQRAKVTGRLISKEELETLGCDESNVTCSSAPEWVYQTSYWSGSVTSNTVYSVFSFSDFVYGTYSNDGFGVRPVIILEK